MKSFPINSIKLKWYTPEEIEKFAECEITVPVSMDKFGHPVPNGTYDLRMGPSDLETICGTCSQGINSCPGHFGFMKIQPVLNPLLFDTFYFLFRSFCHQCFSFKLTVNEKANFYAELECLKRKIKYSPISKIEDIDKLFLETESTADFSYSEINNIIRKYLKKTTVRNKCLHCQFVSKKLKKGVGMRILVNNGIESMELKEIERIFEQFIIKETEILKNIFSVTDENPNTIKFLFFLSTLIVIPNKFRPPKRRGNEIFENPLNTSLNKILSLSTLAEENEKFVFDLQQEILFYFDSSKRPKKTLQGHKQVLEKKEGLFRQNIMGKRVNYSARSVISPDPCLETGEIGIPLVFAKKLTFPEKVNKINEEEMKQLVINSSEYPGANYLEDKEKLINLNFISKEKRMRHALDLRGKIVHRHMRSGDFLLVNRQPTLHSVSLMGHKAKVLQNEKTIRLHYVNCKPYNADFDGDEMNIHFPQTQLARAEIDQICSTDFNFLVPSTGLPIRGLTQDHVVAAAVMTMKNSFFTGEEFTQIAVGSLNGPVQMEEPAISVGNKKIYTGKQLISVILSAVTRKYSNKTLSFTFNTKIISEKTVFLNNRMLTGILDKNTLGTAQDSLIHVCGKMFNFKICNDLLTVFSRIINFYLQLRGFTLRLDDFFMLRDADDKRTNLIEKGVKSINGNPDDVTKRISKFSTEINSLLENNLLKKFPNNNMENIVKSGAKGSLVNFCQISICLGQQELEGKRVPLMVSRKSLPCFTEEEYFTDLSAGGLVFERFLTGLSPSAFYFHCMAGREGLIDTAVKTANSGYLQRCLVKHLENITAQYDNTVRNNSKIIQFDSGKSEPGKSLGLLAAQSIGEPSTQMTLNTFHLAGVGGKNVTLGIPRLREIVMVASQNIKTPVISCNMKRNEEKAKEILTDVFRKKMAMDFIRKINVTERILKKNNQFKKTLRISFELFEERSEEIQLLIKSLQREFMVRLKKQVQKKSIKIGIIESNKETVEHIENSDSDSSCNSEESGKEFSMGNKETVNESLGVEYLQGNLEDSISEESSEDFPFLDIKKISKFSYCYDIFFPIDLDFLLIPVVEKVLRKIVVKEVEGFSGIDFDKNTATLEGSNFISLYRNKAAYNILDFYNSYSNDIYSIYTHFGVEACRECIVKEIYAVFDVYGIKVQEKHLGLVADFMTRNGQFTSFSRNSFTVDDSMIQRMSFESCYKYLKESVALSMEDNLKTPSASITVGNCVRNGTGSFDLLYKIE